MRLTRREFLVLGAAAVAWAPFAAGAESRPESRIPVLLYADIRHRSAEPASVPPPVFAGQMERLFSSGYRAVSFSELGGLNAEAAKRSVILTFDGGYVSFMTHAFPLLREYGFKATVNIIGTHAGGYVNGYDPRLSWDECRALASTGMIEIGCQTYGLFAQPGGGTLPEASAQLNEKLIDDLALFQKVFTREMGSPAAVLAWPQGIHDPLSIQIAKQAGFRYLLGSEPRQFTISGDLSDIPRLKPGRGRDLRMFEQLLGKNL